MTLRQSIFWQRRRNCCSNFYQVLRIMIGRRKRRNAKLKKSLVEQKSAGFIYASPYELPPKSRPNVDAPSSVIDERLSEIYSPASLSFRISSASPQSQPPPLPERNFNVRLATSSNAGTPLPATPGPPSPSGKSTPSIYKPRSESAIGFANNLEILLEAGESTSTNQNPRQKPGPSENLTASDSPNDSSNEELVSVEVHPKPPSQSSNRQPIRFAQENTHIELVTPNQHTTSSLQQLQALDLFQSRYTDEEEEDEDKGISIRLETDQYVQQMKQRRGQLLSQIDTTPADRLRRKFGYEIERRLVKVSYTLKRGKRRRHKRRGRHSRKNRGFYAWIKSLFVHEDENILQRRRRRYRRKQRHRLCLRCITSSFHALFISMGKPIRILRLRWSPSRIHYRSTTNTTTTTDSTTTGIRDTLPGPRSQSRQSLAGTVISYTESRTPTPKMLLDAKHGTLHWPVYQVGGKKGSGMLISTRAIYPAPSDDNRITRHQPGRENFSLASASNTEYPIDLTASSGSKTLSLMNKGSDATVDSGSGSSNGGGYGGRKIVGWLQVRDPKNKKSFLQVVDPAPKGPFRKAPWHNGTFHVLKL